MNSSLMKTRSSSLITTRKIVANEHLNPNGTLFGGHLMCWIDEVAFICARRFTGHPTCVTVSIDNITFKTPLRLGEHVLLSACVNHVGSTSMQIEVQVKKEDPLTLECLSTNQAHLTFVCLDRDFQPLIVPRLVLESVEDHQRNRMAQIRIKVRKKLENFLEKRALNLPRELFKSKPKNDIQILADRIAVNLIHIDSSLDRYDYYKRLKSVRNLKF